MQSDDRRIIYALRCALAHDYSLVNRGRAGNHLFRLGWDRTHPLVARPENPWDGSYDRAEFADDTVVNTLALGDVGEQVVQAVLDYAQEGDLELAVEPAEAEHRYFVTIT